MMFCFQALADCFDVYGTVLSSTKKTLVLNLGDTTENIYFKDRGIRLAQGVHVTVRVYRDNGHAIEFTRRNKIDILQRTLASTADVRKKVKAGSEKECFGD